jgi:hypothetical protein
MLLFKVQYFLLLDDVDQCISDLGGIGDLCFVNIDQLKFYIMIAALVIH